jgi:hypothetical protein
VPFSRWLFGPSSSLSIIALLSFELKGNAAVPA